MSKGLVIISVYKTWLLYKHGFAWLSLRQIVSIKQENHQKCSVMCKSIYMYTHLYGHHKGERGDKFLVSRPIEYLKDKLIWSFIHHLTIVLLKQYYEMWWERKKFIFTLFHHTFVTPSHETSCKCWKIIFQICWCWKCWNSKL